MIVIRWDVEVADPFDRLDVVDNGEAVRMAESGDAWPWLGASARDVWEVSRLARIPAMLDGADGLAVPLVPWWERVAGAMEAGDG